MSATLYVNDATLNPEGSAIKFGRDPVGRMHFRSFALESANADRFSRIQELALRGDLKPASAAVRIALCLILFDGVATRDDLDRAITSVSSVYRWNGQHCLDWCDKIKRGNRRYLSLLTQAALAEPRTGVIDSAAVLSELDKVMQACVRGPRLTYSLELLMLDAQAWLRENISDPLFAHCARVAPIASVPRSTLARDETKLALAVDVSMSGRHKNRDGLARAFGAYLDPQGRDHGTWLIAELVQICRRNRSLSNFDDRQRMLKACLALSERAKTAGRIAGVILAWVIDLLESGTRTKSVLKAITPAKYVGAAAHRLLEAFRGKALEDISATAFTKIYHTMLDGLSSSRARTLASALSSWHYFLASWFDVFPLNVSLHKWLPNSPPKANLLWPHERNLIHNWLQVKGPDERMHGQLLAAFNILDGIRIRATELLSLRICNFHDANDVFIVEISTKAIDGGVKTPAGKRTQTLDGEKAVCTIREWLSRRKKEGALPGDYLFGDPYRPDRQDRAGELYLTLNRLLKSVTGDSSMGTHSLSHNRISFDWADAAIQNGKIDINPFEAKAAAAGHETSGTGFTCYFHFAEMMLRKELDDAITKQFLTWQTIRSHVALSACAFRQARSRWRRKNPAALPGEIALHFMRLSVPSLVVPTSKGSLPMGEPKNPIALSNRHQLTLGEILDVLSDIEYGHSPEALSLRSGLSCDVVFAIASGAIDVLEEIGEAIRPTRCRHGGNPIVQLGEMLNGPCGQRIQLKRAGQGKTRYLYSYLHANAQTEPCEKGIESWIRCYHRGYLSLEYPESAAKFIALLDVAEFPRSGMVVRGSSGLDPRIEAGIEATFQRNKPVMPVGQVVAYRYGRPRAYLALSSASPTIGTDRILSNAALGMSGVHAVMFGAAVHNKVQRLADFSSTAANTERREGQRNG